jgi:hypothetical protein
MRELPHIYRHKKLTNISQRRYKRKYNPEYLEKKVSQGASIKLGFGDFDGDGDLDGLYPKQRAGVAEKPGLHINEPRRGPNMLSAFGLPAFGPTNLRVPTPEAGPLSLEFLTFPPQFGPTGLSTGIEISSTGPAMLNASVVAPAAGPQSLEEWPAPTSGPQDLVAEAPEPIYTVVSFSESYINNLYGEPDGRWYPKEVDDAAIYLGEDAPYKYYAFPLIEGQRFKIVPETQAAYYSNVSRGSGVGNNLWEWYWYKYRPTGGYLVSGSAESKVKYNSYSVNPNLSNPKFSLWFSYPNAYLRDLQYNPYNRFKESDVMAMKSSLEGGEGTGFAVGSTMRINPEYTQDFRTHHSSTPPNPY